jgi:hypothetical protein
LRKYEDPDEYSGGVYHGVRLAKEFSLDDLPDDEMFLAAFKEEGDEDEKP